MNFDCNHVIELVVLITINLINLGFGVFLAVLQAFEVGGEPGCGAVSSGVSAASDTPDDRTFTPPSHP